jgi:hypothetical protein
MPLTATRTKTKPSKKARRPAWSVSSFTSLYETAHRSGEDSRVHPVTAHHGGYGVVAEGYIVGPYAWFENAEQKAGMLTRAMVVRWVDFVSTSTINPAFRAFVATLKDPLTVKIVGYGRQVVL